MLVGQEHGRTIPLSDMRIAVRLALDGASRVRVATGAGLYDHFLEQLAFHAGFDLIVEGAGDLETGDHHTAEDAALALGEALDAALGDRRGIARYGDAVVPMDDALARAAVDLGGRPATEIRLADPGLAEHVLSSFAQAARLALHVESDGRDAHHVAEAAFKAVGRALRAAVRAEGSRDSFDEGRAVRVAICEYGAGNVRSVALAFERLGAEVGGDVATADLVVLPGVGSAAAAHREGLRERGLDDVLRARVADGKPVLGICLGLQLALDETEEDGGVEGLGIVPGRAVRLREGRVPRIGWAEGRCRTGEAFYFAHSYAAETPGRGRDLRRRRRGRAPRLVHRRAVPSREERRRRRALSGVPMPLPRLIPCLDVAGGRVVKGVNFEGLRDVGDPVELGGAYSDAGADELVFLDIKATVHGRRTLVDVVSRVAARLAIPFTVGGGVRSAADAEELLRAGADKVAVNSAALERPGADHRARAQPSAARPSSSRSTRRTATCSRAGTTETPRRAVEWARECEARGAGEILLTSIDADGTRAGYDLELTAAVAAAVSLPVIASGGAGNATHVAEALGVAQAALLASILHEDRRGSRLRDELPRHSGLSPRFAMQPD